MRQVAVGGGQTLGVFLCQGLAQAGYRVAVADLHAQQVAQELDEQGTGKIARGWQVDTTREQSVISLAQQGGSSVGTGRFAGLQRRRGKSGTDYSVQAERF